MNIYDFKKLERCFVCGNIDRNMDRFIQNITSNLSNYKQTEHPKEIERQERLRARQENSLLGRAIFVEEGPRPFRRSNDSLAFTRKIKGGESNSFNDSVIIVGGNCGIGSKSMKYYNETFERLNEILLQNNCILLFVRGNNDDPSIFNECKIDFSNVKTIPDYSVVILKHFNCLCIGGSTSLDKEWKLSQEKEFGKKLFWECEQPFFDEKVLDEILAKYDIGCVITSTSPSFTFPGTNAYNKSKWLKEDSSIKSALSKERKILDKIYEKIVDGDKKPYAWFYGRFKQHNFAKINDILFTSLSSFSIQNVNEVISNFFGIDTSKKLGGNVFTFDTFITDYDGKFISPNIGDLDEEEDLQENEEAEGVGADMPNDPQDVTVEFQPQVGELRQQNQVIDNFAQEYYQTTRLNYETLQQRIINSPIQRY